jgi:hypothetical protein
MSRPLAASAATDDRKHEGLVAVSITLLLGSRSSHFPSTCESFWTRATHHEDRYVATIGISAITYSVFKINDFSWKDFSWKD